MLNVALLFVWGKPDLKPVLVAYLGLILQGGCLLAIGDVHFHHDEKPDHRRRRDVFRLPAAVAAELVYGVRHTATAQVVNYISIVTHFENFSKGVLELKDVIFYLSMIFFCTLFNFAVDGIAAVEGIIWRDANC